MLHRWISSMVQSRMPLVPSAQPSHVPWVRMRQAYLLRPLTARNAFSSSR